MQRWLRLNWLLVLGVALSILAGCGGGGSDRPVIVGPGLVGIDNHPDEAATAPELTVEYRLPGELGTVVAFILSDQPTDGDIAFDPVEGSFIITTGPDTLLFGIDSASASQPEYRAFLDFPLDGSTGHDVVPLDAEIVSATLTIFVNFVDFAATVPVLLDLVQYSIITGLTPDDYSSAPLEVRSLDIFRSDAGQDVFIDVTPLMVTAQVQAMADFQVRFLLGP